MTIQRTVHFKGKPLALTGRGIKPGMPAPDFRVTAGDLSEKTLADFKGRIKVVTTFPSIDTPVCDAQVREFNKRAASFSDQVTVIGISRDLPFAQGRFCGMNGITNVTVLSDYKTGSFGLNYGLWIRELNLLARAILIIDENDRVRYVRIVDEVTRQPDYDEAAARLERVIAEPLPRGGSGVPVACRPCEGKAEPLPPRQIKARLKGIPDWEWTADNKITRELEFETFSEAVAFLDTAAVLADEKNHHPVFRLSYNKLKITLWTHASNGLTENDFIVAKIIDDII